jgi:predicted ATPase/DNA-binding XRE family transcriptional regulator
MTGNVEEFGSLLKRLRVAAALSQEQLAEKAGLSYRGISDLERGVRGRPRLDTLRRLAEALELAGDDLQQFNSRGTGVSATALSTASPAGAPTVPVMPNPFIGREGVLAQLEHLVQRGNRRLITLHGPGGTGKSRLAMELGRRAPDRLGLPAVWVALAPLTESGQVMGALRSAMGIDESPVPDAEMLTQTVGARLLLIIMDNFEHVLQARDGVSRMLAACPGVTIMTTSRLPLGAYGEYLFPVTPLTVESEEGGPEPEAVALFRSMLGGTPDSSTDAERLTIEAICRRLNGLPLAVELAAARTTMLTPAQLLDDLQSRSSLEVVELAQPGGPSIHESLEAAIAWSLQFLSEDEERVLIAASTFRGGFTREAAAAVADDSHAAASLEALVRGSLVVVSPDRYSLLESIREFAEHRARQVGENDAFCDAHTRYFLGFVEMAAPGLFGGHQGDWFDRLESEHDNIRVALHRAIEGNDFNTAGSIAQACARFWRVRGHLREGRDWMQRTLSGPLDLALRTRLCYAAGSLAAAQSDLAEAERLQEESLELARELGDRDTAAKCLNGLGIIARTGGDDTRGAALLNESLKLRREIGDSWGTAACLINLGNIAVGGRNFDLADELFEESLTLWRTIDDSWGVAFALASLAEVSLNRLDFERAARLAAESLELRRQLGDRLDVYITAGLLAEILSRQGIFDRAVNLALEAITGTQELGSGEHLIRTLENGATVLGLMGSPQAATIWSALEQLRGSVGVQPDAAEAQRHAEAGADAQSRIDVADWLRAWTRGSHLSLQEVTSLALTLLRDQPVNT